MRYSRQLVKLVLWLYTLHTVAVGMGLILMPTLWMEHFGLVGYHGRFFQVQGGVFHIVMGILYFVPLRNWNASTLMIPLFVLIKCIATLFLFIYYLFTEPAIVALLSGIGDGLLAFLLWWVFRNCPAEERPAATIHTE